MKNKALFVVVAACALSACSNSDSNSGNSTSSGSSGGSGSSSSGSSSGGSSGSSSSSGASSSSSSGGSSSGSAAQGIYCGSFTASASSSSSGSSSSGSSSSSSSGGSSGASASCGGITSSPVFFGLVQADGTAALLGKSSSSFVLYAPAPLESTSFSALAVTEFGLNGTQFNGASAQSGTLTGKLTTTTGLTGSTTTFTGTLTGSAGDTANFTAPSSPSDWNRASSLATVAGTYTGSFSIGSTTYSPSLKIGSSGSITGTDSSQSSCTYSGSVTTPDLAHNDYNLALTASCISGKTFTGVGAFFPAGLSNPNGILTKSELKVALTDGASTGIYMNLSQ